MHNPDGGKRDLTDVIDKLVIKTELYWLLFLSF